MWLLCKLSIKQELSPVTATILSLPFIDPLPAPAPTPVDFALPFDFGDALVWLDNLGFMSETSQPLDASSNNVSLANTVPNNNPGGTESQSSGIGELDWLFASVIQGGGHFVAPSSQRDWNASGPDLPDPSSSTGAGGSFSKVGIWTLFPPSLSFQFYSPPCVVPTLVPRCSPSHLTSSHKGLERRCQ
jgi:hypothetical protein